MSEQRESWADFAKRRVPTGVDFPDRDARSAVIEVIHEIVERFITPTLGVLTPQPERAHPPGGEHYCPDDWVPGTHNFDLEDVDFEYWETFATTWTPPETAIVEFLAKHRLQLQRSDQALQFHHVWIGRSASRCWTDGWARRWPRCWS